MITEQLQRYQEDTKTFARYPMQDAIEYTALGLFGEVGEFDNKLKKVIRDGGGVITPEKAEMLLDELGDCQWYNARHCDDLGFKLEDDISQIFDPGGTTYSNIDDPKRLSLAMSRIAGKLAAYSEEYLASGEYPYYAREEAFGLCCEFIQVCRQVAYVLNSDLETVCNQNIAKLQGRADRGTLQGSGDNR